MKPLPHLLADLVEVVILSMRQLHVEDKRSTKKYRDEFERFLCDHIKNVALSIAQYHDEEERRIVKATFIACNQGITQLCDEYEQSLRDEQASRQPKLVTKRWSKPRYNGKTKLQPEPVTER